MNNTENQLSVDKILQGIISLISSLRATGIFNLFSPQQWRSNDDQPGRILATTLYLQNYPQEIDVTIKERLTQIQNQTKIKVLAQAASKVLCSQH